jgi:type IV secretion system protein VirB2
MNQTIQVAKFKHYPNSMFSDSTTNKMVSAYKAFLTLFIVFVAAQAHAEPWDGFADGVLTALTNGFTRTIAIICCIGLGIAAMAGKLTWGMAGGVIGGIVLIFGSAAIVDWASGLASK